MERLIERLATLTDHLVRFQTTELNHQEQIACLDWVKGSILAHKPQLYVQRFCSNGKPSYLITAGKGNPRVLFCAHLDVVDAEQPHGFHATKLDHFRMGGRGVADMKGPAAALIDIMMHEPQTGMGLLLTTDEEIGGNDGTEFVLSATGMRPDVVILPDGGANMCLVTEQKGLMRLRLIAHGQAVHGSRPWLGDNAALHIYSGYQALLQAYPLPQSEEDWRVSIALSQITTIDNPANTVPGRAEGTLDIRYPDTDAGVQPKLLEAITRRLSDFNIESRLVSSMPSFRLDVTTPHIQKLQDIAQSVRQRALALTREASGCDAHYFSHLNIPVLMFQPECDGWHSPNEWLNLESLAQFRTICRDFARATLGKSRARCSNKSTEKAAPITLPTNAPKRTSQGSRKRVVAS